MADFPISVDMKFSTLWTTKIEFNVNLEERKISLNMIVSLSETGWINQKDYIFIVEHLPLPRFHLLANPVGAYFYLYWAELSPHRLLHDGLTRP